jgi:hypothetical protein
MGTFTPPAQAGGVPPTLPRHPGNKLFQHYRARPEGINVFLYSDGTVSEDEPDGTDRVWSIRDRNGDAINATYITRCFYGGHDAYEISQAEADLLTNAGYTVDA